ncbi:MAG: hypothetical protein L0Y58_08475 [Verrucomicrobia subdivision 3 bacterium]|nr:hypothetical protein [Limisphaerales bacterium]
MTDPQLYKRFVAQFSVKEWKQLCKHRLFLHFLKVDIRQAAIIASEALDRTVVYLFPTVAKATKIRKPRSPKGLLGQHPRFRIE